MDDHRFPHTATFYHGNDLIIGVHSKAEADFVLRRLVFCTHLPEYILTMAPPRTIEVAIHMARAMDAWNKTVGRGTI